MNVFIWNYLFHVFINQVFIFTGVFNFHPSTSFVFPFMIRIYWCFILILEDIFIVRFVGFFIKLETPDKPFHLGKDNFVFL
uniref:Uncharacterized protein MANES_16G074400 n=1 Tax=Rhizophora mucronata TaxID=61149 RepID=A0A2P2JQC1_RHIMU